MLKVEITPQILDRARKRDLEAGKAFKGASIENGKGRFYGFLGEEIIAAYVNDAVLENTKDYDLVIDDRTFDVKTKTRKDEPKSWYDATVDESAHHQNPDYYIFVQILAPQNLIEKQIEEIRNLNFDTAWILGYIDKKSFYENARFFKRGSVDPSNGIKYRDSIYLLKLDKLYDAEELLLEENES